MVSLFIKLFVSVDRNSPTTGPDWPFLTIRKPVPIKSGTAAKEMQYFPIYFSGRHTVVQQPHRRSMQTSPFFVLFGLSFASVFLWLPITFPGDRTCDFREIILAKACQGSTQCQIWCETSDCNTCEVE